MRLSGFQTLVLYSPQRYSSFQFFILCLYSWYSSPSHPLRALSILNLCSPAAAYHSPPPYISFPFLSFESHPVRYSSQLYFEEQLGRPFFAAFRLPRTFSNQHILLDSASTFDRAFNHPSTPALFFLCCEILRQHHTSWLFLNNPSSYTFSYLAQNHQ
jgi:hypothetical protein